MNQPNQTIPTLMRRKQVEARTGLSRSTIYAYMADGKFPTPVSVGVRAVGWLESEISEWLDAKIAQRGDASSRSAK